MAGIAVFAVIMAVMLVAKVASVALMRDDVVAKSTSFSWEQPSAEGSMLVGGEAAEKRASSRQGVPARTFGARRARVA